MQFFFRDDAPEDARKYQEFFKNITWACDLFRCPTPEDTVETDELVPSGVHYKVRCASGHVTNGIPPARFRNTTATPWLD
ncbi:MULTISPECIES: hypothetical protein [Amycolatopsis]|uniref:Uncharacterized protein n=2 Tax=Amycolatopsis TaxID=1813 RepID=A0A2N3WEY9_9PSEU|nr:MULTISPECIES: hypothetical protein [Amycolatopsis]MBB2506392.1 hypothetical protein [Amycolatopsis echigonensis]PKV92458.1 hypothetical protein ATK30_3262 [Amycolatopsis niigatensis]TVT16787.1 hypothetical protein FNH06_34125 [Amycolatopsis acidiphila]UIJ59645.1 hypothetical protein LWP59_37445 [Amycolatopsis acidiphila]GHG81079.1 hypothetical protein GCM10017788_50710 [Amycolatopsis acidiphila]